MSGVVSAKSRARNGRLAAGRDYAAEVVQQCELQNNLRLEDKILADLSGIVMDAVDCLRSDQPFRSPKLPILSLEMLTYLRQTDKPMIVNFACAFTMLMSELEGINLAERQGSHSIQIPESSMTSFEQKQNPAVSLNGPSSSKSNPSPSPSPSMFSSMTSTSTSTAPAQSRPQAVPIVVPQPPPIQHPPAQLFDMLIGEMKEEDRSSVEFDNIAMEEPLGQVYEHEEDMEDGGLQGGSGSDTNFMASNNDMLQLMAASFTTTKRKPIDQDATAFRSMAARLQKKGHTGKFESRDGELAKFHKLPVTADKIEQMSEEDLQQLLQSQELTEHQCFVIRQIRRRARNKLSSREYRKRLSAVKKAENAKQPKPTVTFDL